MWFALLPLTLLAKLFGVAAVDAEKARTDAATAELAAAI